MIARLYRFSVRRSTLTFDPSNNRSMNEVVLAPGVEIRKSTENSTTGSNTSVAIGADQRSAEMEIGGIPRWRTDWGDLTQSFAVKIEAYDPLPTSFDATTESVPLADFELKVYPPINPGALRATNGRHTNLKG